ncbi:Uncharacterised protein [Dermatophilus congolensis]|uniref:Uncharacterized protein n=1 Tax=Dermatophilus congolensis TaxID=1863 RepID=A0AA46GZJ9_9MICO|nr:Uncharacterised protein [Dermatophilus congolensis]
MGEVGDEGVGGLVMGGPLMVGVWAGVEEVEVGGLVDPVLVGAPGA